MANYTKRDERAALTRSEIATANSPEKRARAKPGPPPTLGQELRHGYKWFWFWCPRCDRCSPMALAPFAIRYGVDVRTIDVAKFMTCSKCRHAGALLQRPSVIGLAGEHEIEPFPTKHMSPEMTRWISRQTRTRCPAPMRGQ